VMLAHRHDDLATCSSAEMVWHNRYDFRIYVLSTNSMLPLFVTILLIILRNCHISCHSNFTAGTTVQ
jgi:hypothetical protein